MKYISKNENETKKIAGDIAKTWKSGSIVCLHGDLGAGKTTFVKGIAEHYGIKKNITSPTFTLMNLYETNKAEIKQLIHIDTYRLKNEHELVEIGAEDYIGNNSTLSLIEWPEKIKGFLDNKKVINVFIDHLDQNSRQITVE